MAFSYCTGLTAVTIPDSVTSIGALAFAVCRQLTIYGHTGSTAEKYAKENKLPFRPINATKFTDETLFIYDENDDGTLSIAGYNGQETEIALPPAINGKAVTDIGSFAFSEHTDLTAVTLPDSVTSIGNSAFSDCTGLTAVTLPDSVTRIEEYAFAGCKSLTAVTIPDSVTRIENNTFDSCTSLHAVTIPDSVTSIGDGAFDGCASLASVTIPDSVTSIGDGAFDGCRRLTAVTIPDSVTSISDFAFYGCPQLTIYGHPGGYAESYAKKHSISFRSI